MFGIGRDNVREYEQSGINLYLPVMFLTILDKIFYSSKRHNVHHKFSMYYLDISCTLYDKYNN